MAIHVLFFALMPLVAEAAPATSASCAAFNARLHSTYGFHPSKLSKAESSAKSEAMDGIWKAVEGNPATLAPCLKEALAQPTEDTWFLYDGSQLLVKVDHSSEAKLRLLDAIGRVSLDDVDLRSWVAEASAAGLEGLDTSELGRRWLSYPEASYYLPEHAYHVDRGNGALFIFGTLDERFATPALIALSRTSTGAAKEIAVSLLMSQATPEALRAVAQLDTSGLSPRVIASRKALLEAPELISPRNPPRTTRAEFLAAFAAFLAGDAKPFDKLVEAVPDGERDLVAVSTPADLEIIRKVRRRYIASNNQHTIEYYNQFTQILMTLVWKPQLVKDLAR
ncbi:MAG TPA: hypothetical protein VNN08_18800 [Thermoanaerobaculia bacterium]|nr:hypothetical protein [Thermoanaerobaculia bacterium]